MQQTKGTETMKKTLIAFAAVAAIATGMAATASTAQAKVHLNLFVNGYGGGGFYDPGYYGPSYYDDEGDCHYATIKKVKWINGHKHVFWKQKLVCY
jgi:hypothetical protein